MNEELTPRYDKIKNHNEGKSIMLREFGIRYPNGKIEWFENNHLELDTQAGRDRVVGSYTADLNRLNMPYEHPLQFLTRVTRTTFDPPQILY